MILLAHCHTYGRNANNGADKMLQGLLEYLVTRGITCNVVIDKCPEPYVLNGVHVSSNRYMLGEAYETADAVIIHLVVYSSAVSIAKRFGKKIIHLAHNDHSPVSPEGYVIYNSHYLQSKAKIQLPSIVVNPVVTFPDTIKDHFNEPYVTLVNTCPNKGGDILAALVRQMPNTLFLAVAGGYGKQLQIQAPNLHHRAYSSKMDYSDTRILIVPSKMESWSMCAAEAMANGIPVVCATLPGLVENCGDAAMYCGGVVDYINAIKYLSNPIDYSLKKALCYYQMQHRRTQQNEQLENLYNFIFNMSEKKEVKPAREKKEIQPKKEKNVKL